MTTMKARRDLAITRQWNACENGYRFLASQPSFPIAWQRCQRGDWMAWLLFHAVEPTLWGSPERRLLAGVSAEILESLARPFSDVHTDAAICAMIALLTRQERGECVTREQLCACAAWATKTSWATTSCAAEAAWAAARAAGAAGASCAAEAARAAEAAGASSLAASADIIRAHYPKPPRLEARTYERRF